MDGRAPSTAISRTIRNARALAVLGRARRHRDGREGAFALHQLPARQDSTRGLSGHRCANLHCQYVPNLRLPSAVRNPRSHGCSVTLTVSTGMNSRASLSYVQGCPRASVLTTVSQTSACIAFERRATVRAGRYSFCPRAAPAVMCHHSGRTRDR